MATKMAHGMKIKNVLRGWVQLLGLILFLVGSAAEANWVPLGEVDGVTFYVELSKVKKTQEGAYDVWWMNSFSSPQHSNNGNETYRSIVFLSTFDCATEMAMSDGGRLYSGEMATGTLIGSFQGEKAWKDIQPQTVLYALFQMVCVKR